MRFKTGQKVKLYSPDRRTYKIARIVGIRGTVYDVLILRNNRKALNIPEKLLEEIVPLIVAVPKDSYHETSIDQRPTLRI
jgi:hypothetical protein